MKVSDFNYELPEELIAQVPIKVRSASRLMVLHKNDETIEHKIFKDVIDYLKPGDCLVRNNTKVIPARLYGIKDETGIQVEFLLLNRLEGKRINDSNNTHCNISSIIERTESLFLIVVLFLLKLSDLIVTVMHLPVNHRCTSIFKSFTRLTVIWCNPDTLPVISSKPVK